jgi:plasmid stabilization system protein ParE
MAKPIVLTSVAEEDLERITEYVFENWGPIVCDSFLSRFEQLCELISASPGLFPVIYKKKKVRKCVLSKQNIIYYREHAHKIEIIAIFDTRKDPDKLIDLLNA